MIDRPLNPVIDEPAQSGNATDATAKRNTGSENVILPHSAIRDLCELSSSISSELHEGQIIAPPLLQMLLSSIKYHDEHILLHSQRVAVLAIGVGKILGWNESQLKVLETAALLHDVGKIGIPQHILLKPGALNHHEQECISQHQHVGNYLLQACHVSPEVTEIIMQSSRAYCLFNQVTNINLEHLSLGARILAVADAYDSLRNDQVYRPGKSHVEAISILQEQGNTRFDLSVVGALHRWLKDQEQDLFNDQFPRRVDDPGAGNQKLTELLQGRFLSHILQYLYSLEIDYHGFYLVDQDLEVIVWNRGMELLTGHSSREILGKKWSPKNLNYRNADRKQLKTESHSFLKAFEKQQTILDSVFIMPDANSLEEYETQSIPVVNSEDELNGIMEVLYLRPKDEDISEHDMRQLKLAASRDALTQLPNRGELEKQLETHWKKFQLHPEDEIFSVLFLDVDFFKSINDHHGHAVGDQVLIDLARLLQNETYSGEIVGRFGGEEFVILCPNTQLKMAIQKAKRFRLAIEQSSIGGMSKKTVTASFGVAQAEAGDKVEDIVRRADKALYEAKETGRNKVCWQAVEQEVKAKEAEVKKAAAKNPYEFRLKFDSPVNAETLTYKLEGYIHDTQTSIENVSPSEVRLMVGKAGMFSKWGKSSDKQPVQILLELKPSESANKNSKTQIIATVTPQSGKPPVDSFRKRSQMVLKNLAEYLQVTLEQATPE